MWVPIEGVPKVEEQIPTYDDLEVVAVSVATVAVVGVVSLSETSPDREDYSVILQLALRTLREAAYPSLEVVREQAETRVLGCSDEEEAVAAMERRLMLVAGYSVTRKTQLRVESGRTLSQLGTVQYSHRHDLLDTHVV